MNIQGHNNIRNGIVWVQTSLHVIEPQTHQKFELSEKSAMTKSEFESAN